MEIKLILVDLDLTLLQSDGTLSERTISTLAKCKKSGIQIGFSTSRGTAQIKELAKIINPEILICNAGACIYYKNELIHAETFTLEETHALFNRVYEVLGPDAEITVDTLNDFFWNRKANKSTQYMPESKYDDCRNFPEPAMKFCVQTDDKAKAEEIIKGFPNCSAVLFSDIPWHKFAPKSASKENAIAFISDYLKISTENMVSFGDDFSDIGMLKTTGIGVAMGNAIPQVKEIAAETTLSCDQDGVAVWLEEHVL